MINDHYTEALRTGRKFLAWAIILEFFSLVELLPFPLGSEVAFLLKAIYITELCFIGYGIYKISQYYQYSHTRRVLYALGSAAPFIGLFLLVAIEKKSSKSLQQEGYKVTFLGASRRIES